MMTHGKVSREQLLAEIETIREKIRPITIAAGVQEQHFDKPFSELTEAAEGEILNLHEWIQAFHDGPYSGVMSIWKLKPTDWWDNMSLLFGLRNTREHKLLKAEQKLLRKSWYSRYRKQIDGEDQEGQESVQDPPGSFAQG